MFDHKRWHANQAVEPIAVCLDRVQQGRKTARLLRAGARSVFANCAISLTSERICCLVCSMNCGSSGDSVVAITSMSKFPGLPDSRPRTHRELAAKRSRKLDLVDGEGFAVRGEAGEVGQVQNR